MRYLLLGVCLIGITTSTFAAGNYRKFTSADGKTVRGKIVKVDMQAGKITIEKGNRKTATVPVKVFTEEDQDFIKNWAMLEGIRSSSKLKISCDRRIIESWNENLFGSIQHGNSDELEKNQVTGKADYDKVGFEITLQNRNDFPLENFVLEYCIYYEQVTTWAGKPQQGILYKSIPIENIDGRGKKTILTDTATIFKAEKNAEFTNAAIMRSQVHGITIKLFPEPDSDDVIRSVSLPESIWQSHPWSRSSKKVGKN